MIKMYFGSPGCGKTTHAVYQSILSKKKYRHCVCNFENSVSGVKFDDMNGAVRLFDEAVKNSVHYHSKDYYGLGSYRYSENTLVIIDEAGIQYNNRKFKTFPAELVRFFKKHRHYKNDIILYSQSWEDVDITIRRLTDELWYIKKLGPFTMARKVRKFITITDSDYQIIDGYKFESPFWSLIPFFGRKTIEFIYRPKFYKYFDSYSDEDNIPVIDFTKSVKTV